MQRPPLESDFAFLPVRERHIAGFIDALPDGAVMDVKSLAKVLPLYGQMAVGSALKALSVAGHLRRVRERSDKGDQGRPVRWVTRTYWSRIARDNEWWNAFLNDENEPEPASEPAPVPAPEPVPEAAPVPEPEPVPASVPQQRTEEPQPQPETRPQSELEPQPQPPPESQPAPEPQPEAGSEEQRPSKAYMALARLGRADSRLALSAADCAELEQMAAEWLERGVGAEYLTGALTAGLPDSIGSPFGFVRRRLRDKLPPRMPVTATTRPAGEAPVRRRMVECTECRAPGRPEAFRDGLCKPCRQPGPAFGLDPDPVF
ncbi:MarR family transcriptional regulator [Streptomyces sp. NPDC014685]|uniref:MarR family transcriptional regulator n=1 Tax=Streptomyces sp. NPDC014685 TaxID=3364881 RepID=UPI0036F553D4